MSQDVPLIDLHPAPIERAPLPMHPADARMWFAIGSACFFTLGFALGSTFHIWIR